MRDETQNFQDCGRKNVLLGYDRPISQGPVTVVEQWRNDDYYGQPKKLGDTPAVVPHRPPQMSRGVTRDVIRRSSVTSQRITA